MFNVKGIMSQLIISRGEKNLRHNQTITQESVRKCVLRPALFGLSIFGPSFTVDKGESVTNLCSTWIGNIIE
jgi:hypothetical protein